MDTSTLKTKNIECKATALEINNATTIILRLSKSDFTKYNIPDHFFFPIQNVGRARSLAFRIMLY